MPEICRFFGIIIAMYHDEHNPPHFHAKYGTSRMEVEPLER
jgi:phosphomannomutase